MFYAILAYTTAESIMVGGNRAMVGVRSVPLDFTIVLFCPWALKPVLYTY